jgi:cell cycle sensor histidine kinase DivJ
MDDLVTWHDHTGGVLKANTPGAKTLGAGPQQLQGRGLFNRIHVADRPAYLKALSDAAAGQEPVTVQFRVARGESPDPGFDRKPVLVRLGGRKGADRGAPDLVWMEMRAHRLRVPGEDGSSVVAVTRSIAAHKQQTDELEALHRKAQHATEERARLLATVSHELRTPLTAIIGYADMLRSGLGTGPRAEDYAGIIHHSGEHMLGLVSSLLNLCAIEAGGRDLEPEPVDVAALIEDCCRTLSLGAERAGIAIDRVVPGHLPEMWADRQACEQILLNLLSNAVKFTPRGGRITVEARRDGERLALTVRDTGIGVLAAELPRLGSPFYRAASGQGLPEGGHGLGLSVVRGLVGLHQGRIDIASAPGDGTRVTVSLPLRTQRGRRNASLSATLPQRPIHGALALKTG